ncbi:uncharacterized protein V6R79_008641 [Siganus canaliculatus]
MAPTGGGQRQEPESSHIQEIQTSSQEALPRQRVRHEKHDVRVKLRLHGGNYDQKKQEQEQEQEQEQQQEQEQEQEQGEARSFSSRTLQEGNGEIMIYFSVRQTEAGSKCSDCCSLSSRRSRGTRS